jgi:hypothetical protein
VDLGRASVYSSICESPESLNLLARIIESLILRCRNLPEETVTLRSHCICPHYARISHAGIPGLQCQILTVLRLEDSRSRFCELWLGGQWQAVHIGIDSEWHCHGEVVRSCP